MRFFEWIAKNGKVGGAARKVADGWKEINMQKHELAPKEIAMRFAALRFGLLDHIELQAIQRNIDLGRVKTPTDLTWALLEAENRDDWQTLNRNEYKWRNMIRKELSKNGLNPDLEW